MPNFADPGSPEAVGLDDFLKLVVDRRPFHVASYIQDDKRVVYTPATRTWTNTTGITLHQTACDMGERPERYDTMGAHWGVLRSGKIIRLCDNNRIVYHGNGWNGRCVGIEVNGLYAGREDDPRTAVDEALQTTWDNPATKSREKPQKVTAESMRALRMLCRYIAWDIEQHGGHLAVMGAHRQSSKDRRNDPGEAIWKGGALPIIGELGLSDGGPNFVLGGYALPECWDETNHKSVAY
jgi:hypothetical protein